MIKCLLENSQIEELLSNIFDDKYQLIEDLLSYMIIEESCAYEYFEYFERKVCTNTKSIYSDSSVSRLLKDEISNSDINTFLDAWNKFNSNLNDVYVNIDSTNFSTRNDYGGLSEYGVSYVTSKVNLASKNEKPLTVYVHVYYDGKRAQSNKEEFLTKIDTLEKQLVKLFSDNKLLTSKDLVAYEKYFNLRYNSSNYLISYKKDNKAILDELNSYGYFALMSEKDMSAEKVLETYSQRDSIEKLFRVLKSSLDFDHMGVYSKHSLESKVFLTFIASIIRNEIYIKYRKLSSQDRKNLTIPVILKELSKIEASLNTTNNYYSSRYALTAKQKRY